MFRALLSRSAATRGRYARTPIGARGFNASTRRKAEVQLTVDGKQVSIEGLEYRRSVITAMEVLTEVQRVLP